MIENFVQPGAPGSVNDTSEFTTAEQQPIVALEDARNPEPVENTSISESDQACRTVDPEIFFGPIGENTRTRLLREEIAKSICNRCSGRLDCLEAAIERREEYGVWGGVSFDDLRNAKRRRTDKTGENALRTSAE